MGLLSRFRSANRPAPSPPPAPPDGFVQETRVRARRRLIGAALLLGAGVVAFPLLFETQPRPVPVDVVLDIPDAAKAPPLAVPRAAPSMAEAPAIRSVAPAPGAAPLAQARADAEPASTPVATAVPARAESVPPPARPADTVVASTDARTPPKDASREPARGDAADAGRFVVQVGAFAEEDGARGARRKVEALGLKTYTQEVRTADGKRIRVRVGPYAAKAEAQKAADRIKSAGLPAAVLTL